MSRSGLKEDVEAIDAVDVCDGMSEFDSWNVSPLGSYSGCVFKSAGKVGSVDTLQCYRSLLVLTPMV